MIYDGGMDCSEGRSSGEEKEYVQVSIEGRDGERRFC